MSLSIEKGADENPIVRLNKNLKIADMMVKMNFPGDVFVWPKAVIL